MSRVLRRRWESDLSALSRKDRVAGTYEAYVPDKLCGRSFTLDAEVAADVADAEAAITRLNAEAEALVDTEILARLLLRAESVASSRIEGLEIGPRRLLRADAGRHFGEAPSDVGAREILANIDAMSCAVHSIAAGETITVSRILDFHRRLLAGGRWEEHGGRIRDQQNWIGGSDYHPCAADFVPPPPEFVEELLADLCEFCNGDELPAVAQAALAHAQFETIHPFIDGNGRTGRGLIHLVLRRRGLAPRVLPPVSLVLATWAADYVDGLSRTRYRGPASSSQAHEGLNLWVGRFATACLRSVDDATSFEHRAREIQAGWYERLGRVRADSAPDRLVHLLVGVPVVTVTSAAELIDRSFPQTAQAIDRLVEAGVLTQITVGKRNRAFEAPEVIHAFADLERRPASPVGDTRKAPPARVVPRRARPS